MNDPAMEDNCQQFFLGVVEAQRNSKRVVIGGCLIR
jgi:hypothetical protein